MTGLLKTLNTKIILWISLSMMLCQLQVSAQGLLLEDKVVLDSVKASIHHLYNFRFDQSQKSLLRFKPKYGNHPGFILLSAIRNYWKYFPIGAKPKEYEAYKKDLNQVIRISESMMKKYPKSPEPVYYFMTANLILARHHSEEGEFISAVNETRKAFPLIKRGFKLKTAFPDFYFTTGLYNYYRVAFPENHPVYSAFTVFFPDGNKEDGLKDLAIASQKSYFSSAEALIFLCGIALRDYYDVPKAMEHANNLNRHYPGNWVFSILYGECLLESGLKDEASPIIKNLLGRTESAALLSGYYLQGLQEKMNGHKDAAKWNLQKALMYGKTSDRLTKGQIGLAYNELAKIAMEEGNKDLAKKYFRLAGENCSYTKVKRDAAAAGF